MTGRGIDQVLPHPNRPHLFEPYVRSALHYVEIAERASGPIPRPVDFAYPWGDALAELERIQPHARIINLETAVTTVEDAWPAKGINYRMHPANVQCLTTAEIDCCVLANNHVVDWGYTGLGETLDTLHAAGLRTAGAGRDDAEAKAPAAIDLEGGGRVLIFAFGCESAGVPPAWAADKHRAGVNFLGELTDQAAGRIADQVSAVKHPSDIAVVSLHWGGNWGYPVPSSHRAFAHRLIDSGGVDAVHGHSSHHPMGIEIYHDKLILYGCGDFLNDYEGIGGYEVFRSHLTLMYFPTFERDTGRLLRLALTPMQVQCFRVRRPREEDVRWLGDMLDRESRLLGTMVERQADDTLLVTPL